MSSVIQYHICGWICFTFWVSACVLSYCDSLVFETIRDYKGLMTEEYEKTMTHFGNIVIVIIVLLFAIGVLGICLFQTGNKCCCIYYAIFILVVLILEVAALSLEIISRGEANDGLETSLRKYMDEYKTGSGDTMDDIHQKYKCCGINGIEDFTYPYPESCCSQDEPFFHSCNIESSYNGCYEKILKNILESHSRLKKFWCAPLGIVVFCQIIALCVSCQWASKDSE